MSLRYGGRPVTGFLGAPDAVAPGIAALQAAIAQYGGSGVTNPAGAVAALQAAGNAAVGSLGPALDASSGSSPDVMRMTQWAWAANGKLAAVNSSASATQADVDAAKGIVSQMFTWYDQARRLVASQQAQAPVSAATPRPALPAAAPSPPPAPDDRGWLTPLLVTAGVVVVGGSVVGLALSASRRAA